MKRIVIIGGGAAGLMAACTANYIYRNGGAEITVIEKNERPARKLMITGKGRCNVCNNCDIDTLIANVPENGRFLYSAFSGFAPQDTMTFFESLGVSLKTERGNRVFPVSDKASDIVDALVKAAKRGDAEIIQGTATKILTENGAVSGVLLENGEALPADSVILATGGMSYPLTGSTGDGYKIARALGHTVTEIKPSLVALNAHEGFCERLAGLSLKNLVLSASAHMRYIGKKQYTAAIDLKPGLTPEQLDKRILRDFDEEKNRDFINSLNKLLPKSIIPIVVRLSCIEPDRKVNSISREQRAALCRVLKEFTLHITGTRPIDEAIITRGGISVKEIDPKTMGSRLISGLYFAGEIIDVDAYTGGFNLQIAFSTGFAAGSNV